MSMLLNTYVIVPVYNEASVVFNVLRSLLSAGYPVIAVDDGSTDDSYDQIVKSGAAACRHLLNLGQGAALQTGITYALSQGAEYLVTFDADAQHRVEDVEKLLQPLISREFDIAMGSRFLKGGAALDIPPLRKAVIQTATLVTRVCFKMPITDTHNGLRALNRKAAQLIRLTQPRMSHASQFYLEIRRNNLRFTEVPVIVHYTDYSLRKGQRLLNLFNIAWDSVKEVFSK